MNVKMYTIHGEEVHVSEELPNKRYVGRICYELDGDEFAGDEQIFEKLYKKAPISKKNDEFLRIEDSIKKSNIILEKLNKEIEERGKELLDEPEENQIIRYIRGLMRGKYTHFVSRGRYSYDKEIDVKEIKKYGRFPILKFFWDTDKNYGEIERVSSFGENERMYELFCSEKDAIQRAQELTIDQFSAMDCFESKEDYINRLRYAVKNAEKFKIDIPENVKQELSDKRKEELNKQIKEKQDAINKLTEELETIKREVK